MTDCTQNTDPLKLVREGTSQDQRMPSTPGSPAALDPAYAPVDGRTTAHDIVFAQSYSALLKYFGTHNAEAGDWQPFFSKDVCALLAMIALEDVDAYRTNIKIYFDYLNQRENHLNTVQLKNHLGYLYNSIATLAQQLDLLKEELPVDTPLKGLLRNLITTQLAPAFSRLIAYYKAAGALVNSATPSPQVLILRTPMVSFASVLSTGLSQDWSDGFAWTAYESGIDPDHSVYGNPGSVFARINHVATHNLFESVFDQFLKVYARIVSEASVDLEKKLTRWDKHEPHYALFLAFLRLFEYVRQETNTLTGRHLDFYYREILRLKEKPAEPGHAHLLVELAKQVTTREFKTGELFKAGKDDSGHDAFFANELKFVANKAKVAALKSVYRYKKVEAGELTSIHENRFFASPIANSDNGMDAKLTTEDQSWHPFYNKVYADGELKEIRMPKAEIGLAIASHYLLMAGGTRTITLDFSLKDDLSGFSGHELDVDCQLTSEKDWIKASVYQFTADSAAKTLKLVIDLTGADPAITSYLAKTHGYNLSTELPVLLVKLRHTDDKYIYSFLQDVVITKIVLTVDVTGLKILAVSNDFGQVDTAKPFQPYGSSPVAGNSLIIGSKEVFQKKLNNASVSLNWLSAPAPYTTSPNVSIDFLSQGEWNTTTIAPVSVSATEFPFTSDLNLPILDESDFTAKEFYSTSSCYKFARLKLMSDFGQSTYQSDLLKYLRKDSGATDPGKPPVGPTVSSLSMTYTAEQEIELSSASIDEYENRKGYYFHLAPFGQAEQHPFLNAQDVVYLLPQFDFQLNSETKESEAEFYIGITGLRPPQNLALLFQVADGTAAPLTEKPRPPHIHWSYLKDNEWCDFGPYDVQDDTGELLNSGIITFAMPSDASDKNSILPSGMFWIRAAVYEKSDAVCRLKMVAAQAIKTTFVDKGNSSTFSAKPLAEDTISKLDLPDSAVKTIKQPFSSFGGRQAELPAAFYTRISERLRHKDRAIALWDYERLVLEAFPQIYKVKCLNHTHCEPSETGGGIYRELAQGHVTVVTIPNLQFHNLSDPLKPYTSLGLLEQIKSFLQRRLGCFIRLHVMNPRFEEVRVEFGLRLLDGFDENYYSKQLQLAITHFLSPWAFADGGIPSFGGKIYKSVLINFIEDQPYVDYVTDFKLFHDIDDKPGCSNMDEVEGSAAISILVSAPATKHLINIIKAADEPTPGEVCSCAS